MEEQGLIRMTGVGPTLTDEGVRLALQVIRAHRLLERYLHDELRVPLGELHAAADKREHQLSPEQADRLEMRLGYPRHDPHGDPIPSEEGELAETETRSLLEWPIESPAVIVHLEDEPSAVFSQLMDAGLYPGMRIEILESGDRGFILWDGLREYSISSVAAGNVSVVKWTHPVHPPQLLTTLKVGHAAVVRGFNCEGLSRRRLLDLGLTPGTRITHLFDAGFGDPRAFEIRGAVIALRRAETDSIEIERVLDAEPEPAL
jgi:DtxR family transcriptional regulator, Mn-dependent transcriptional regulator